jgi:hypothetical protein
VINLIRKITFIACILASGIADAQPEKKVDYFATYEYYTSDDTTRMHRSSMVKGYLGSDYIEIIHIYHQYPSKDSLFGLYTQLYEKNAEGSITYDRVDTGGYYLSFDLFKNSDDLNNSQKLTSYYDDEKKQQKRTCIVEKRKRPNQYKGYYHFDKEADDYYLNYAQKQLITNDKIIPYKIVFPTTFYLDSSRSTVVDTIHNDIQRTRIIDSLYNITTKMVDVTTKATYRATRTTSENGDKKTTTLLGSDSLFSAPTYCNQYIFKGSSNTVLKQFMYTIHPKTRDTLTLFEMNYDPETRTKVYTSSKFDNDPSSQNWRANLLKHKREVTTFNKRGKVQHVLASATTIYGIELVQEIKYGAFGKPKYIQDNSTYMQEKIYLRTGYEIRRRVSLLGWLGIFSFKRNRYRPQKTKIPKGEYNKKGLEIIEKNKEENFVLKERKLQHEHVVYKVFLK